MTSLRAIAKEKAEKALPCYGPCGNEHGVDCPAARRPAVEAAIVEAMALAMEDAGKIAEGEVETAYESGYSSSQLCRVIAGEICAAAKALREEK